ncbi:MAG: hypothetical protein ACFFEV_09180 [Candidatus Thorarchaeota archaeon]
MSKMGVALDSLVLTMEYAGVVAVILLIYCLCSRHQNNSSDLNVFQRLPLLLPALGFIFTIIIVTSYGFTPMGMYHGVNTDSGYRYSEYETNFTILDNDLYTESLEVSAAEMIDFNESIYVDVAIYQNESLVDIIQLYFEYSSTEYVAGDEDTIQLSPGTYLIQMNFTYNYQGIEDEGETSISFAISQPLVEGFTQELVDWSTYQFIINISCIGIFLAGICIGSPTKKPPKVDETDWKTTTEYDY